MLLVPLLVGIAVFTVAVMSRVEMPDGYPESPPPADANPHGTTDPNSLLRRAFPHLQMWAPSDDLLGRQGTAGNQQASRTMPGAIGPDIIVGPWSKRRRQDDSYADAA